MNVIRIHAIIATLLVFASMPLIGRHRSKKRGHHWKWETINTNNVTFPQGFIWGSASSALQVEGNTTNSWWTEWENGTDKQGNPNVPEKVGIACDHWNRYKEDIKIMKDLGLTAYRFSVEWSKIEPEEGVFNQEALDHYRDVCQELVRNGIKPVITLHHYTEPIWFFKKGSFDNPKNIHYFVRFCSKVFEELHDYVHLWLTFNSACSTAAHRYLKCNHPPAEYNIKKMVNLMGNVLDAHVEVYHALKALPGGNDSRIGILKNIFQLDPHHPLSIHDHIKGLMGKRLVDTSTYTFFTTGHFKVNIPGKVHVSRYNKRAPKSLDFIGLNYYSHGTLKNMKIVRDKREIAVDNPRYSIYAEGLYRAIRQLSDRVAKPLNIPIYITENGIATHDESLRELFFKRYLYALSQAIKDGHDVRGYITWAFMDNYSWGTYDRKYGLIPVDRHTLERGPLRSGARYFIDVVNQYH